MTIVLESSSDHVHTFICLLFAFCSFWPFIFFLHPTIVEHSVLRNALEIEYTNTSVVSNRSTSLMALSLLAPFFLDYFTELCVIDRSKQTNVKKKEDEALLQYMNHYEKTVFIIGLFIVPIVAFVSPTFDDLGLLWLCASRFQIIVVVSILRVSLYRIDVAMNSRSWITPWWSHMWFITILAVAVNFSTWTAIYGGDDNLINFGIDIALKGILLLMLIVPFGRWLLRRFRRQQLFHFLHRKVQNIDSDPSTLNPKHHLPRDKKTSDPVASESQSAAMPGKTQEQMYFPTLYITVGFIFIILLIILLMVKSEDQFSSTYLSLYNVLFIVIELLLLYYDLRKNKYDSQCHLRALVESRKQYLRYIAHEMRTPLNSAVLGLQVLPHLSTPSHHHFLTTTLYVYLARHVYHTQLIVDALKSLEEKNDFDEMLHETASDVSKTLSVAVEILANLMTFNKIETGIMTLHKQDINVKQYVNDVAKSFAAEAREKGTYSANNTYLQCALSHQYTLSTYPINITSQYTLPILGIRFQIRPFRTIISDSDSEVMMGRIAGWYASLQRSKSESRHSRDKGSKSKRNILADELGHDVDLQGLELLDSDMVFADKFKIDQVNKVLVCVFVCVFVCLIL